MRRECCPGPEGCFGVMTDQCLMAWLITMGLILIGLVFAHLGLMWRLAELQKDVLWWVKHIRRLETEEEDD